MAESGAGSAGRNRAKNAAMAAYMKQHKIERSTSNCPMCHLPVKRDTVIHGEGKILTHIMSCKGRKKAYPKEPKPWRDEWLATKRAA